MSGFVLGAISVSQALAPVDLVDTLPKRMRVAEQSPKTFQNDQRFWQMSYSIAPQDITVGSDGIEASATLNVLDTSKEVTSSTPVDTDEDIRARDALRSQLLDNAKPHCDDKVEFEAHIGDLNIGPNGDLVKFVRDAIREVGTLSNQANRTLSDWNNQANRTISDASNRTNQNASDAGNKINETVDHWFGHPHPHF